MIDYELAKKLKEAGFPQKVVIGQHYYTEGSDGINLWKANIPTNHAPDLVSVVPTLSELISAIGIEFYELRQELDGKGWLAKANQVGLTGTGISPEIAVANLFLALNSKP